MTYVDEQFPQFCRYTCEICGQPARFVYYGLFEMCERHIAQLEDLK